LKLDANFTPGARLQQIAAIVTADEERRVGVDIEERNRGRTGIVGYRFELRSTGVADKDLAEEELLVGEAELGRFNLVAIRSLR
jgi:hypothetical protein